MIGTGALYVSMGQIEEILLGLQDGGTGVIQIQKRLQIFKVVGGTHFFDAGIRQADTVFPGQLEHHFRLQRAFDV